MADVADLIGVPFATGGRGPDTFDCFGLVREVYRRFHGVQLPDFRTPSGIAAQACVLVTASQDPMWQPTECAPGVIVALRVNGLLSHVGVVLDERSFIHAWRDAGGVCIERLDDWSLRVLGYYRYAG